MANTVNGRYANFDLCGADGTDLALPVAKLKQMTDASILGSNDKPSACCSDDKRYQADAKDSGRSAWNNVAYIASVCVIRFT